MRIEAAQRFWSRVALGPTDECWPWTGGVDREGYGRLRQGGRDLRAHRHALELVTGQPVPAGVFACHRCDNPPCCNPAHLFLGSPADNTADMVAKGRARNGRVSPKGEAQHAAKLTERAVQLIRERIALGDTQESLARRFGVTQSSISKVVLGRSWRHVA